MAPASRFFSTSYSLSSTDQDKLAEWRAKLGITNQSTPAKAAEELKVVHAVRSPVAISKIMLSDHMAQRATRNTLKNIDLVVCDMAGTVVNEVVLFMRRFNGS